MTTVYEDLVSEPLPASNTDVYTAGAVSSAHVIYAAAFNSSASPVALTGYIVKNTDSADSTNQYVDVPVPSLRSVNISAIINAVLKTGDKLVFSAGTASAINLKIGIKEVYT
jgi:hypothetical protein